MSEKDNVKNTKPIAQKKKIPLFSNIAKFFKELKVEFSTRIIWPTKKQIINNTMIVLGMVIVFSVVTGLFDLLLRWPLSLLLQRQI